MRNNDCRQSGSASFVDDDEASTDHFSLHIDRTRVHVGSEITGRVDTNGNPNVVVEFEGIEYTVVALPGKMDSDDYDEGMDKQHDLKPSFVKSEKQILLQNIKI